MGGWGPGVFQNDTALDFLGDLVEQVCRTIQKDLSDLQSGDSYSTHRLTVSAVSILAILAKNLPMVAIQLSASEVRVWKQVYFEWFDKTMPDASLDWKEMRRITKKQFDQLIKYASKDNLPNEVES